MRSVFSTPAELRQACRVGQFSQATAGQAPGYLQANLMIVPQAWAFEFLVFCQRNPQSCPLIEVLEPGQYTPRCAPTADLRTDLPGYRVYQDGALVDEYSDVADRWRDDWVSFLIGCSFSFESALIAEGIGLRHIQQRRNVAMYRSTLPCVPSGRLRGNLVVSMRPIKSQDVARAVQVSARFPLAHGAPIHVGHPELLGIKDLMQPDYGDAVEIMPGELPVFWACGVTPQAVAVASRLPVCITHAPGKMLVTDQLG